MRSVARGHRLVTRFGGVFASAGALIGYGALQRLGRSYGSTRAERSRTFPCDELCPDPQFETTHATTVDASPEQVWSRQG